MAAPPQFSSLSTRLLGVPCTFGVQVTELQGLFVTQPGDSRSVLGGFQKLTLLRGGIIHPSREVGLGASSVMACLCLASQNAKTVRKTYNICLLAQISSDQSSKSVRDIQNVLFCFQAKK